MYIGRGCSKERVRSAVIKMIEAKFKLELLTQKSFYDVIEEPLKAGEIKIVKAHLHADGSLQPVSAEVGVSVTLDWKQGGSYDSDI